MSIEDRQDDFISEDEESPRDEVIGSEEDDEFTDSEHSQGVGKSIVIPDEIPSMLKELNELGVQALKNTDETEVALDHLKKCEQFLEVGKY